MAVTVKAKLPRVFAQRPLFGDGFIYMCARATRSSVTNG